LNLFIESLALDPQTRRALATFDEEPPMAKRWNDRKPLKHEEAVDRLAGYFVRTTTSTLPPERLVEQMFDLTESLLFRIPADVRKRLSELPHDHRDTLLRTPGIDLQLRRIEQKLRELPDRQAGSLRRRHVDLLLWANAKHPGRCDMATELAIVAAAHGALSLGDFVCGLVANADGYGSRLSLVDLLRREDWWNRGIDPEREERMRWIVQTLESIIREQEDHPDDQLPECFGDWYQRLPRSARDKDLIRLLRRHRDVELTRCLSELTQLAEEGLLDENRALRLALINPGLVPSIADFLDWLELPEILVWLFAHLGSNEPSLAYAMGYTGDSFQVCHTLLVIRATGVHRMIVRAGKPLKSVPCQMTTRGASRWAKCPFPIPPTGRT